MSRNNLGFAKYPAHREREKHADIEKVLAPSTSLTRENLKELLVEFRVSVNLEVSLIQPRRPSKAPYMSGLAISLGLNLQLKSLKGLILFRNVEEKPKF